MAKPVVTVVVVNYNGAGQLGSCLASVTDDPAAPSLEILVVDNASTDDSAAEAHAVAQRDPRVRVIVNDVNRGYAGAVNVALANARGRHLAVLNMDVRVGRGWLGPLLEELDGRPEVGAVCPLILLDTAEARINAAGQELHLTGLGFNRLLGRPVADAGAVPFALAGLHGGAFVIRRELLEGLGGWDETGFLYGEDVQLSWLLRLVGAEMSCVPGSVVRHSYYLTMEPRKLHLLERNRAYLLLTNLCWPTLLALGPLLLLTEAMLWGYCTLRGPRFVRAKLDAYRWVARHRAPIRARRATVRSLRRRSDRELLSGMRIAYPLHQLLTLGRERGASERRELPDR